MFDMFPEDTSGLLQVNALGDITFELLADAGLFEGELGIFSLAGMENFAIESAEFIQEAAQRTLSDSSFGHILFKDATQGALFDGQYDQEKYNAGSFGGPLTFTMAGGDLCALILVPNGTLQEIADNPTLGGDKRPIFSIAAANLDGLVHVAEITEHTFNRSLLGFEDVYGPADFDFNDLVFDFSGINGRSAAIAEVVQTGGWITSSSGTELISYFEAKPHFSTAFELADSELLTGEAVPVQFGAAVANPTGIGNITVSQFNAGTSQWVEFGQLFDDGDLAKGDDIAGDGVFNNRFVLNEATPAEHSFVLSIPGQSIVSEVDTVSFFEPLSQARAQDLLNFDTAANAQLKTFLAGGVTTDQALDQLVAFLATRPDIVNVATITKGAASVLCESTEGILMMAHAGALQFEGQRGATDSVGLGGSTSATITAAAVDNTAGCNSAIVLGAYAWQFEPGGGDESNEVAQLLGDAGFSVTLKRNELQADQNISIADFKNLDDYNVVAITSHGDNFDGTKFQTGNQVVVLTADKAGVLDLIANFGDLVSKKLVLNDGTFAVTSSFIRKYNSAFDDSIIYMGSCRSTFSADMANAFLDEGAAAFIGYSDYVGSGFANERGQRLFTELLAGKTTGNITGIDVDRETDSDPALFDLTGSVDATLSLSSLDNGSFQDGDFQCWKTQGDARIITALASLTPTDGTKMAIISTGLGSVSDSNSAASQRFLVAEDATTLSITYDAISEEPLEFVGTAFDDTFQISLNGSVKVQETINTSTWLPISGIDFAGGDSTTFHTGFKTVEIDLSPFRGTIVELDR